MFLEAKTEHGLDLINCLMIGDSPADIQAGDMLGMETMLVLTGRGKQTKHKLQDVISPTFTVSNIKEGSELLIQ